MPNTRADATQRIRGSRVGSMLPAAIILDAVILAGGRSARLGGEQKAGLVYRDRSLLSHALGAAEDARLRVIVGHAPENARLPKGVIVTRESPAFGGPAAGIAAGFDALEVVTRRDSEPRADYVLLLACDMPGISEAIPVLVAELDSLDPQTAGVIAVDGTGHPQRLAGIYRAANLAAAIDDHRGSLTGLSVRALMAELACRRMSVPAHSTLDIDTWSDAAQYGIAQPGLGARPELRVPPEQEKS
jgi:molybdopterin-guanine dinucleotide biosynthesis protein A